MNIYAGNLSYEVADEDLQEAFAAFGQVSSARVIKDRDTGRSRGFGFVEMPVQAEAQAAIEGLNGKDLKGRVLNVNEARPRTDRRGGPGGRGGGGGGGGRRRY
jgi:RNA recognition motif-containing protein